jgi:hypothetical protein
MSCQLWWEWWHPRRSLFQSCIKNHLHDNWSTRKHIERHIRGDHAFAFVIVVHLVIWSSESSQMILDLKKRAAWMSPFPSQLTTHRKTDCYLWTIFKQKNKWLIVCVLRVVVDFLYHTKHVASYILKCVWLVNCSTQPPCFAHLDLYFCQLCFITNPKWGKGQWASLSVCDIEHHQNSFSALKFKSNQDWKRYSQGLPVIIFLTV